jgi:glyoxylate reductase
MRAFVTRPIPEPGLRLLREAGVDVAIGDADDERGLAPDALRAGAQRCDALLSLLTERVAADVLALPNLRGVANMAVGIDNIDVAAATRLGVPVSNTPGILTESTADLTWALLLAAARRVPQAHAYTVAGRFRIWGPGLFLGRDVGPGPDARRKVLGIVGLGRIGAAVARRARGFDMDVLACNRGDRAAVERAGASFAPLQELLARSDFVTLHVPLTDATRHLIGERELRAMQPSAFLINTARGPVVDERALVRALREGWIAGAGLDVYEHEPTLADGLAELDNVVLLPHIASATTATRERMAVIAARNALCHLRGERAPDAVNPEVYASERWRARVRGA